MRLIFLVFTFFIFCGVQAQDSVLVTKNFKFQDGIYLNFRAFQQNRPDYSWQEVNSQVFINGESFISKTETFILKNGTKLPFSEIWGFSYNGIPYIRVLNEGAFATFSALRVRGKLCYFTFEEEVSEWVEISAYNPVNGRPFRTGKVERIFDVIREKMLFFETGEIQDFNHANFLKAIKEDDPPLWEALAELTAEEASQKLFKSLLIYDDRQQVFTRKAL